MKTNKNQSEIEKIQSDKVANDLSPPTGLSLGTPPVNRPPIGAAQPDGLPAPLPLAPAAAAPPPFGSENHNHRTDE